MSIIIMEDIDGRGQLAFVGLASTRELANRLMGQYIQAFIERKDALKHVKREKEFCFILRSGVTLDTLVPSGNISTAIYLLDAEHKTYTIQ